MMMTVKGYRIPFVFVAALAALAGLLFLLNSSPQAVQANGGTISCVTTTGTGCDVGVCGGTCYGSVQDAVDGADTGDEILVATGTYTGVHARNGFTQVVFITKTVTIRGGYSGDLTGWDPETYPTRLDAQRQGRVFYIDEDTTAPTLDSLIITGGDANGQITNCPVLGLPSDGCGGGIFSYTADPIILNNVITDNVAGTSTGGRTTYGGGICLRFAFGSVISNNLIINNTASLGERGHGGGMYLYNVSLISVISNRVLSNTASTHPTQYAWGGGFSLRSGAPGTIQDNLIQGNRTNGTGGGDGGAGIQVWSNSTPLINNRVVGNIGSHAVYLGPGQPLVESNQIVDNDTEVGIRLWAGAGGGPTLVNNVIARSGDTAVLARGHSVNPLTATLVHNTLVGEGTGNAVYVESTYVTLYMTNTIVAGFSWGITNTAPATSTVEPYYTLFHGNTQNGIEGANPVYGDPVFVDPGGGDYHIGPGSAAVDAAVVTTVDEDVDGDPRPIGSGPDIGADEARLRIYLPLVVRNN